MKYSTINKVILFLTLFALPFCISCTTDVENPRKVKVCAPIFPDYTNVTIPSNMAPLNFLIEGRPHHVSAKIHYKSDSIIKKGKDRILFNTAEWTHLIHSAGHDTIHIKLFANWENEWIEFPSFYWHVDMETIDPFVTYRVIEPGYASTNGMKICTRNISNFKEHLLIDNTQAGIGCINCHSFCSTDESKMLFHARQENGGTFFKNGDTIRKIDTKAGKMKTSGGYPSWHPSGDYVAFSVNQARQDFYSGDTPIKVYDLSSDIVIYDIKNNRSFTNSLLMNDSTHQNYPIFSPHSGHLYFCTAPIGEDALKLSLCRITIDPQSNQFGTKVDTLINAQQTNKSIVHPKISPCGNKLVYTEIDNGSFSNYDKTANLRMLTLHDCIVHPLEEINSPETDSYHTWSSNSKWLVFSSRRLDGVFTRIWVTQINDKGESSKPFLLPQENPEFYRSFTKSYNVPELSQQLPNLKRSEVADLSSTPAEKSTFRNF
ncbi:MAG: TolB family protein [Tannerellaceae bacterium]